MSNMLLRTLTFRSIIGFGEHRDLTVQELCNLNKHAELIKMYYGLEKINFAQDVLDTLRINHDRIIKKPGKSWDIYYSNIRTMIDEIIAINGTFEGAGKFQMLNEKKAKKKHYIVQNCIRQNKEKSKIHNRNRNQRHG